MEEPKYGGTNKSIGELEQQFDNSDDKSLGFDVDSFNWDEDEVVDKANQKINLGQYQDEDKDEYEDDFEDEPINQKDHSANKSQNKNKFEDAGQRENFTNEEEQIMKDLEKTQEKQKKMDQKQKQVQEIAELIEMATKSIVSYKF